MVKHLLIWLQAILALSQVSLSMAEAKAGPKGQADPWDWQKNYPVFQPYAKPNHELPHKPDFLPIDPNVLVTVGQTAKLPCRVKNLFEHYTVSWIRAKDVSVLSVGHLTFSSDKRISVLEEPKPRMSASDWSLTIANASVEDTGVYECQINTDPKINKKFYLTVKEEPRDTQGDSPYYDVMVVDQHGQVSEYEKTHSKLKKHKDLTNEIDGFNMWLHDNGCICPKPQLKKHKGHKNFSNKDPEMTISGGAVQYVTEGDGIELECTVSELQEPPHTLLWERRGQVLTVKDRPGISLEIVKNSGISRANLFLGNTVLEDTGNYTCVSDDMKPETILLVVTREYERQPQPQSLKKRRYRRNSSPPALPSLLSSLLLPLAILMASWN